MISFIRFGDATDHGGKILIASDRARVVGTNERGKECMGKALVCNGDETTTGGHVIAKASTMFDGERRIALDRETATCGNCPDEHPIQGTGTDMDEDGRASVLDGDQVLCPCGTNHVKASPDAGCSA